MKPIKFFIVVLVAVAIYSCKKTEKVPSVTPPVVVDTTDTIKHPVDTLLVDTIINAAIDSISTSKAKATAQFNYSGNDSISEEGFVISVTPNPTTANRKFKADTVKTGQYTTRFKELKPNTTYYTRGYAIAGTRTFYSEELTFTIKSVKLEDDFGGGVVVWLDSAGQHGIIAAKQGLGISAIWGCKGLSIPGLKSEIGTGKANTILIVQACTVDSIAARKVARLTHNGYSDWYLPSKDELNLLYQHRAAIGYTDIERWSSTESNADNAWAQPFDSVGAPVQLDKSTIQGVRPIRYF